MALPEGAGFKSTAFKAEKLPEGSSLHVRCDACTGQFLLEKKEKLQQQAIALDYDECLHWFEMTKAWETEFDSYFNDSLVVFYEDLVKNYTQNMQIIQEYLNIRVGETRSPLKKQARLPLDKAISNFHQLKSRFAGSEWAVFFEPEDISVT
jgi:hypothetical protein